MVAQKNFRKHSETLENLKLEDRFRYIFDHNLWSSEESRSGVGSTLTETEVLRREVPKLLSDFQVKSILDIPCGDFRWFSQIRPEIIAYTGADIVAALIRSNTERFPQHQFLRLDLTQDPLPYADLVLCRDCLVHLSFANIEKAIQNVKRSTAKWLLMTNFLDPAHANEDIADGDWRTLNFELAPFHFPKPERVILENCLEADGAFSDKALCLWSPDVL